MKVLYTAAATATGAGRNGHVRSSDGLLEHDLALPVELGGTGAATNPEQLFAAGYAACFLNAVQRVAQEIRVEIGEVTVTADVGIGATESGSGFVLTAALSTTIAGVDEAMAARLAETAYAFCPYSNAIRGNVDVVFTVATA